MLPACYVPDETTRQVYSEWANQKSPRAGNPPNCENLAKYLLGEKGTGALLKEQNGWGVNSFNIFWFVKDCNIKNLDELMSKLPKEVLGNWLLKYKSLSVQQGTEDYPRIIINSPDGKTLLAISANPKDPNFQLLEMIEWDENQETFVPTEIVFKDDNNTFDSAEFTASPAHCSTCHANSSTDIYSFRPNFSSYNFWPFFIGSSSRNYQDVISCLDPSADKKSNSELIQRWKSGEISPELCTQEEAKIFLNWVQNSSRKGRYKFLPTNENKFQNKELRKFGPHNLFVADINEDNVIIKVLNGATTGNPMKIENVPQDSMRRLPSLNQALAPLNAKRISREIVDRLEIDYRGLEIPFMAIASKCVKSCDAPTNGDFYDSPIASYTDDKPYVCEDVASDENALGYWYEFLGNDLKVEGLNFREFYDKISKEQRECAVEFKKIQEYYNRFGDNFNDFQDFDWRPNIKLQYALLAFLARALDIKYEFWSMTQRFNFTVDGNIKNFTCHQFDTGGINFITDQLFPELRERLSKKFSLAKDCKTLWFKSLQIFKEQNSLICK